jgi:hypothetical protein
MKGRKRGASATLSEDEHRECSFSEIRRNGKKEGRETHSTV